MLDKEKIHELDRRLYIKETVNKEIEIVRTDKNKEIEIYKNDKNSEEGRFKRLKGRASKGRSQIDEREVREFRERRRKLYRESSSKSWVCIKTNLNGVLKVL